MPDARTTRRSLLTRSGVAALGLLAAPAGRALGAPPIPTGSASGAPLSPRAPASLLTGCGRELDLSLRVVAGAVPPSLSGHYFVVAAAPQGDGTFAFNGDGMVHRVDLAAGAPRLTSRFIKTPCWYADQATRGTRDAFQNLAWGPGRMSFALGARNQANTALLPLGSDRLLATTDAGRPMELDPVDLRVVTPVGWRREWRRGLDIPDWMRPFASDDVFPLVMSSAHPARDPRTGELFTVNFGGPLGLDVFGWQLLGDKFTDLVRWDGQGPLERWRLVEPSGAPVVIRQSVHQVTLTAGWVLVLDTAFRTEVEKPVAPAVIHPQDPTARLWLVRRADLVAGATSVMARPVDLPREAVHLLADFADPGDRLTVHVQHNCASDGSEWLLWSDQRMDSWAPVRRDLHGMVSAPTDRSVIGTHVIDAAAGRLVSSDLVGHEDLTWGLSLYACPGGVSPDRHEVVYHSYGGLQPDLLTARVAIAYAQHPNRTRPVSALAGASRAGALLRFDVAARRIGDSYRFPWGRIPSSPEFVPRAPWGPTDGHLVCTVISDDASWADSSGDELWVFDAADLASGPVCRLGHPELRLPFTLHTAWMQDVRPRAATYRVDVAADHQADVARLSPDLQRLFARDVYPHF